MKAIIFFAVILFVSSTNVVAQKSQYPSSFEVLKASKNDTLKAYYFDGTSKKEGAVIWVKTGILGTKVLLRKTGEWMQIDSAILNDDPTLNKGNVVFLTANIQSKIDIKFINLWLGDE
jgi:hypothetical protein